MFNKKYKHQHSKGIYQPTTTKSYKKNKWKLFNEVYRRKNQTRGVEVEGVFYEDKSEVTNQVVDFYKKLYQELESWRPTIDGLDFACLDKAERYSLEREFEKEEVLEALKEAEGDKAPGPDDFTMAFFQKCWECTRTRCYGFFRRFS